MNPAEKFILRDRLKEKLPSLTDDVLYDIISELDKLGALAKTWEFQANGILPKDEKPKSGLPQTFNMVSPMWSGKVSLVQRENFIGYQDDNQNVRIYGKSEKDVLKKITKYRR